MSSLFSNLVNKIKIKKAINNLEPNDEYAFSLEEIDSLQEENAKKIKDLKEDRIGLKKEEDLVVFNTDNSNMEGDAEKLKSSEELGKLDNTLKEDEINSSETVLEIEDNSKKQTDDLKAELEKDDAEEEKEDQEKENESFVNLSKEHQNLIMNSWNLIDNNGIDKDILEGKDILSHNYNITYGDNAAKFIHDIRKKYEIVICYLIGFNNEKNGIFNKTIFSDRIDNEWKYLENYIKLLEKIRNFKK